MTFKDLDSLAEAYTLILSEAKKPDKDKDGIPDWADKRPTKKDDEKEDKKPVTTTKSKKSLPFMKEDKLTFSALYKSLMSEDRKLSFGPSPISGAFEHDKNVLKLRRLSNGEISKINDEEQYVVTWKNPEKHNGQREQPLKGESVTPFLDEIEFLERAFPEQP
jgi:hypothetical protein